ncbi:hypothetical protein SteCoe_33602 [Stentor coeruleus]|uniref:Transmembrane protein n=1 Tax=Stentor coeruleus TaxID=5963 RepID=A0A1R2AWE3_9CILI|nr:hypothetical protein SteCoe_33602 [Stentor coeruleus]
MSQPQVSLDDLQSHNHSNKNYCFKILHTEFAWPWSWPEIIEFFLFGLLGAAHSIIFSSFLDEDLVKNDTKRHPILETLAILCPIAGVYGMFFFKLKSYLWINLSISLLLVLIPLIILIIILGLDLFIDLLSLSVACIFIAATTTGLAFYKKIRRVLYDKIGYTLGGLLSISLLLLSNALFNLLISILLTDSSILSNPSNIIKYASVLYLIFLTLIWISINSIVYTQQPNEIQSLKQEILDLENPSLGIQTLLNKSPDLLKISNPGFISNNGHIFASLSILAAFISIEIGLLTICSSTEYPSQALYMSGFYIIAVPCFLFLGTIFSASSLNKNDKYCIGLLLLTVIPSIFIMWISYFMYTKDDFYYLGILVGVGFPSTIIYWLSLSMIFAYNKRSYQYFSAICCLVTIVPLGLMWPLYSAGGMKTTTFWTVCGILFFGGVLVFLLWLVQFVFKLNKELVLLIKEMRKFNGHDLSQYLYSLSFVLGFCLLAFMTFKRLDSDDWISGFVPGCLTILAFMIFGTVFIHRKTLYLPEIGLEEPSLRDIILSTLPETTSLQQENLLKKKKYQSILAILSLIITFSISIPLLVSSNDNTSITAGITIIIGLILGMLILIFLIELKSVLRQYGDIAISYSLGCCWVFFLIPIICLIPVSLSSTESDEDLHNITSWSVGSILLIFMIGVSAGSITLNLLFRRLEYEKIAKYCCERVRDKLTENGVKAKLVTLRSIYDNFRISGSESVEKVLVNATVYNYHELEQDPDLRYSKEILTIKEISKLKTTKNIPEVDVENKKTNKGESFVRFIRKLCSSIEEDEQVKVPEELKPEELIGISTIKSGPINKIFNSIETPYDDKNWDQQFKENVERQEKYDNRFKNTIKLDEEIIETREIFNANLEEIVEAKIKPKTLHELMSSKQLEILNSSDTIRGKWLEAVFSRFSNGFIEEGGEPWMNLSDLRHFIRLSGLKPFISYAACDILYVRMTRIYDPTTMTKTQIKIDFSQFSQVLLKQLGRIKYHNLSYQDAESKIFSEIIYPNLVTNLPYLYKHYPSEILSEDGKIDLIQLNPEQVSMIEPVDNKNNTSIVVNQDNEKIIEKKSIKTIDLQNHNSGFYIKGHTTKKFSQPNEILYIKCLEKYSKALNNCIKGVLHCIAKCFGMCLNCLVPTSKYPDTSLTITPPDNHEELYERRQSPSWEVICNLIVTTFYQADTEARKSANENQPEMQFNLSNIIGIIGHITEVYSFASVGFLKQVGWIYGSNFTSASTAVLADNDYWVETYWICFSCSIIFSILVIPAIKYIKQGRFGLNADFTIAGFPSTQFFLSKFIGLFGKTMYLTILSAMLSAFSCVYDNNSWHLMRASDIECFSQDHGVYFALAIFSLIIYYPFATLLFPNLAFQDKALDIKFDTTYLVLESQGKVIIAAFAAFFAKERYVWLQLIVSICVSGMLFIFNLKMKPCLIPSYNLWKAGGFLAPVWVCSCALLNYYTEYTELALSLLVIGLGVLLGVLLSLQGKLYGFKCFYKLKHFKSMVAGKDVVTDKNSEHKKLENLDIKDLNSGQLNSTDLSGIKSE